MSGIHFDDRRGLYLICATMLAAMVIGAVVLTDHLVWEARPPAVIGVGYGV